MHLTPWKSTSISPFFRSKDGADLAKFQREMNSFMTKYFNRADLFTSPIAAFYPALDVIEKDNKYVLNADLPGMSESEIDIELHGNILTIKGEKQNEKEIKDSDYVCVERTSGSFQRDIYLDEEVDLTNIKADLKDGVIHVEIMKKDASKSAHKKIAIRH